MRFSVIIPVYNSASTLRRCIDSLINQKFKDREIILVDDGSTDGSGNICDFYADWHPSVRCIHEKNAGVSAARNAGIAAAKGEYLLFVDSDDFVNENYFTVISDAVSQKPMDLLLFGAESISIHSGQWNTGSFSETTEAGIARRISWAMEEYLFSSICNKAFRKSVILENGLKLNEEIVIGEDALFLFSFAMHIKSIVSVSDTLYEIDIGDDASLSRKCRSYLTEQMLVGSRLTYKAYRSVPHSVEAERYYIPALAWTTYRSAYACFKELLKFDYTSKRRRREIRRICEQYNNEKIRPRGFKCRLLALPVQIKFSRGIDWAIRCRRILKNG